MTRFLCFVLLSVLAPALARAESDQTRAYTECLETAESRPQDGWEMALAWAPLGGNEAARHCGAIALIGLGQYGEAGHRLEILAQDSKAEASLRAEMLGQAGQAWLLGGDVERAYAVQSAAIALAPDRSLITAELLVDRALSLAEFGRFDEALADLDRALDISPRAETYTFRATALRYLDRPDEAWAAIAQALDMKPASAEALLERGILHRLAGRDTEARHDWLKILALAPHAPAADSARRNLELLDIRE